MRRRVVIAGIGLAALGVGLGTLTRKGYRYPPGIFEPEPVTRRYTYEGGDLLAERQVFVTNAPSQLTHLRAFGPFPLVRLLAGSAAPVSFSIGNIHPDADLVITGDPSSVQESAEGLSRSLLVESRANSEITLEWRFPNPDAYRFAALGDTGGNAELEWALDRAHTLGADFFLHLGDLNYWAGDYQRAIDYFDSSPLPVYVTIGNHDFHSEGAVYQPFVDQIGPRNSMFDLGGIRFLNIDTASDTYPPWLGERGKLVQSLGAGPDVRDYVVFTHRPFADPRPDYDHTINGIGEATWLHSKFVEAGVEQMITGHVHVKAELDYEGIHTYIAGQGLGNDDVIANEAVSQLLIGNVVPGEKVSYEWQDLALPENRLCHPRNLIIMRAQGKEQQVRELLSSCSFTE